MDASWINETTMMRGFIFILILWAVRSFDLCAQNLSQKAQLPPRPDTALSGSELAEMWVAAEENAEHTDLKEPVFRREAEIAQQILSGNFPDFMRKLSQIDVTLHVDGATVHASYWVMPDYLMVGNDQDFLRVPMTPMTAQFIADRLGFFLSNPKITNDVYRSATVKLKPQPLTEEREAFATFVQHHDLIESERQDREGLIAGIKKDVVSTVKLYESDRPDRVALYGWHKLDGSPIQPLYTGHVNHYVDYSHGFRLVWREIKVGDQLMDFKEVLANPKLRPILTQEDDVRYFEYPRIHITLGKKQF